MRKSGTTFLSVACDDLFQIISSQKFIACVSIHGSAFDPSEDDNDNNGESMGAWLPLSNRISQHLWTCWECLMAIVALG